MTRALLGLAAALALGYALAMGIVVEHRGHWSEAFAVRGVLAAGMLIALATALALPIWLLGRLTLRRHWSFAAVETACVAALGVLLLVGA
jgi:hypothetical protein